MCRPADERLPLSRNDIGRECDVGRELRPLTVDLLADLPTPCDHCAYWERTPAQGARSRADPVTDKHSWLTATWLAWGAPGRVAYVDGQPAGYLTYAPAHLVPRALAFPTAPVSPDSVVLMTARIDAKFAHQGLGRVLVQAAAKDVLGRGAKALEVFATNRHQAVSGAGTARAHRAHDGTDRDGTDRDSTDRDDNGPRPIAADLTGRRPGKAARLAHTVGSPALPTADRCLLPVDFLIAVGFHTVRDHPAYPRLRLDLRTALSWREDVEAAVERLFAPVRLGSRRPVGSAGREATPPNRS
jgi:GNAT superfamily N-acetyltransferase